MTVDSFIKRLDEQMKLVPNPKHWNDLYDLLKDHSIKEIPAPLILAAWWHTSEMEKRNRFIHHLNLAQELNVWQDAMALLEELKDDQWAYKE